MPSKAEILRQSRRGISAICPRLVGVRLLNDMHERCAELGLPMVAGKKRRARHDLIQEKGILFIHVPKNAGTAICRSLYGQEMEHRSIRYFKRLNPVLAVLPSVAIMRDPVERFVSAFRHARSGGGRDRRLAKTFYKKYSNFNTIDDALTHVENASSWYQVDHIFRPQSWYICKADGRVGVQKLFHIKDMECVQKYLFPDMSGPIPTVNGAISAPVEISRNQVERIQKLYQLDCDILHETGLYRFGAAGYEIERAGRKTGVGHRIFQASRPLVTI